MDTRILQDIGFTRGEIGVYMALLEFGEATIGPLAKSSGITLAKTYPVLEKLKQKGLVTEVMKGKVRHFQAFNPERIINYLEEKEKGIEAQKQELQKLIPILKAQQHKQADQYAKVYEGFNGMRALYDEAIQYLAQSREDFLAFSLGDEYEYARSSIFFKHYDTVRREKKIMTRLVALEAQRTLMLAYKSRYFQVRFLEYSLPHGIIIFGDTVATLLWSGTPTAFAIHSKTNASINKRFFADMWARAKD